MAISDSHREPRRGDWVAIVNAVRTPLGFFTLLVLVIDVVMVGLAASQQISLLAPLIVLLLLAVGVGLITYFRPLALYHPSDWPKPANTITVALTFPAPLTAIGVELDIEHCIVEVRDQMGKVKRKTTPNLRAGPGGWAIRLPAEIEEADSVRLELIEENGTKWRAGPFAPFERMAECRNRS